MHSTVEKLIHIKDEIKTISSNKFEEATIIAVSKKKPIENIEPLINYGHKHFGENKVQEAISKWTDVKKKNNDLKLHMIGKLQSNKVKEALNLFDYIHSVDTAKLANKISQHQKLLKVKPKIFIQINIGEESQKSGINPKDLKEFLYLCKNKLSLEVLGLMCLPPINKSPKKYFQKMQDLKKEFNLCSLSMGMTSDYLEALNFNSSFLRIGTKIFGARD